MRELQIITIYVVCDDVYKGLGFQDDLQCIMSTAEVMTFSILAARLHSGNHCLATWTCRKMGYFPSILSNSRLCRRVHQIPWSVWMAVFHACALIFGPAREYAVDSFPVPSCQKCRIDRRKLFQKREYLGFSASKKRYFCSIRVHMVVTLQGEPVELKFEPASKADITVLWSMDLNLPEGSFLYADGAYNCFELEDILREDESIQLMAKRRKTGKNRKRKAGAEREISSKRQIVETSFSCITSLLPRSLILRTERGFMLRVISAILAYSFSRI